MHEQLQILGCTAGREVREAIDASGEPPIHQLRSWYDNDDVEPSSSVEFWNLCNERERYRAEYYRYWSSTRNRTGVKRPVDGVIMPVAPSAAVEEGKFEYYSMFEPLERCSENELTQTFSIFRYCQFSGLY